MGCVVEAGLAGEGEEPSDALPGSDTPDARDASCREPENLSGLSAGRS